MNEDINNFKIKNSLNTYKCKVKVTKKRKMD